MNSTYTPRGRSSIINKFSVGNNTFSGKETTTCTTRQKRPEPVEIPLRDAQPGMILAEDILFAGKALLAQHQELDTTLISMLTDCGISTICIIGQGETFEKRPDLQTATIPETLKKVKPSPPAENLLPPGQIPDEISVSITADRMTARFCIEPLSKTTPVLNRKIIISALAAQGVVNGIDEELVQKVIALWTKVKRRYEIDRIACGTPARPAIEGTYTMVVRHITSPSDIDRVKKHRFFWEISKKLPVIDRVVTGTVIAQKESGIVSVPGYDVFGEPIFTDEIKHAEYQVQYGAAFSPDTKSIVSEIDGIPYDADDCIGVIPINFNGAFEIIVSAEGMTASCVVHPPGPGGKMPPKDEIYRLLSQKGVRFGINDEAIETFHSLCSRGVIPDEPVTIAEGTLAEHGRDGRHQYHFNTATSLTPVINKDGQADYKSVDIINTVETGQKLVTLFPPTNGTDGSNVLGKVLPAKPGKPAQLPQGPHTVPCPDDPAILCAEIDGIVRKNGPLIEVFEGYTVRGDVDFSTGHINYKKTVVIIGDIKAGFNVTCGGDLQVNGAIEDCRISVGGNVLCRYGFVGQGKGNIDAKGDVNLGFLKNQRVTTTKNITIAKEALNCDLLSGGSISIHGRPLSVAGGIVKAKIGITVYSVGNKTGIRTLCETGFDYKKMEELEKIENQLKNIVKHYNTRIEKFKRYQKLANSKRKLSPKEEASLKEQASILKQIKQRLDKMKKRKKEISTKIHPLQDAFIKIEHSAFPGTLFRFGERHHLLKEELIGPKHIRYIDHEIRFL